jgi:protein gp37
MGAETGIAWTDHTFNPWWGCTRVSPGCERCYAESWDARWKGGHWGPKAERRFFGDAHWNEPRKWNRDAEKAGVRRRVFCASMADVFEDRSDLDEHRLRLWHLVIDTPSLDWLLLTKRPENIHRLYPKAFLEEPPENVWLGTTAEDQRRLNERAPRLCEVPAAVRFLSIEPQLESIEVRPWLHGPSAIDWMIVGGESGAGAREFRFEWARLLLVRAREAGTAFFMKQSGANPAEYLTRLHVSGKGDSLEELPEDLRVREFPEARRA